MELLTLLLNKYKKYLNHLNETERLSVHDREIRLILRSILDK